VRSWRCFTCWRFSSDVRHASPPFSADRRCPEIVQQIDSDGQTPQLLRLWGQSLNRDEITGTTIVAPHILGAIGDIAGLACDSDVVHAGLQHTYGYLFSTIETPFGFKRDRWVKPELEQGLGITEPAIRPHPSSGTLLGNLTYLLGRIAFRGRSRELRVLRSLRELVSPAITGFPFAKQAVVRVAETVRLRNSRVVSIQSDFVQLTKSRATNSDFLLVYSFRDSSSSLGQLITAFPVTAPFVLDFAASETLGMRPVRTRFNGYLDGLSGKQLRGERTLTLISGQCPSSLHGCLGEQ
jgi:hypothetical protein